MVNIAGQDCKGSGTPLLPLMSFQCPGVRFKDAKNKNPTYLQLCLLLSEVNLDFLKLEFWRRRLPSSCRSKVIKVQTPDASQGDASRVIGRPNCFSCGGRGLDGWKNGLHKHPVNQSLGPRLNSLLFVKTVCIMEALCDVTRVSATSCTVTIRLSFSRPKPKNECHLVGGTKFKCLISRNKCTYLCV